MSFLLLYVVKFAQGNSLSCIHSILSKLLLFYVFSLFDLVNLKALVFRFYGCGMC